MAEEDPRQQQADRGSGSLPGLLPGLQGAEASALQLRIKNSICKSIQSKVENILQDVEKFSDIEKLYLYLNLPSGPSGSSDKSDQSALSSSRTQQMHAFSWIRNHLEEYPETSLPKQEVYDEYKSFCDNLNYHPLSAADFGKMMKNVFPNMKARRLGMRGKSKYPLVEWILQCDVLESQGQLSSIKEEVRFAACDLVCEWAQKVLKRQFDSVEDLARFLIDSHYISNKSLAALTIMSSTATEVKTPQMVSAFVPTAEAHSFQPHSFQPHVSAMSSPSVDAKQQLQRKIQRKQQQQEQKLHSPLLGDGQTKKADDSVPCGSPSSPSAQPAIGIVVAAVPSPITVQRSRQLMSPSPVGAAESKVLPINFQMVTQPVQPTKQSPKTLQNILTGPVGERTARQRYAQILPKPSATTAITLRSPSTMIIASSPIKTVMTTCHVSPVSLVKMAAISLTPNSSSTTTSHTNTTLRPASTDISSSAFAPDAGSNQSMRGASAVPIQAPVARPEQAADTHSFDVEMEVEAIHKNSQIQNHSGVTLTQGVMENRPGCVVQRAASVPIPQTKGLLSLEETSITECMGTSSTSTNSGAAVESSNTSTNETNTLVLTPFTQSTGVVSLLNSNRATAFRESSSVTSLKEGLLSTKGLRKRSGLSPDFSPVKRVFMPQQPVGGAASLGYGIANPVSNVPRPGGPTRPESAPASREVEMKINFSTPVHTLCSSSFKSSGFCSVTKTQSSMQRKSTSAFIDSSNSVSHVLLQEQQGYTAPNVHVIPNITGPQKHSGVSDINSSVSAGNLEGAQQLTYSQSNSATEPLEFFNQASLSSQIPMQTDMSYFPFDDDVTQDSIVEELVQMEEQMKLNNLQEFGDCVTLQGQQAVMPENIMSPNQAMAVFYHAANNSSNTIHTPTPTPTPTPTSEMMGGVHGLTVESPCSRIASTTPVDSALGSSRYTPVGTPHSNCSSTVPPSPVECRNPFAFTPINSNITGFHDGSTVSSSPVKPMQRPMATHPDKTRLEWMNNSYNSSSGTLCKSNSGMGILPSYQGLIDDQFQKPHAFAVPHARYHDSKFGRLTPISPVQQQVASMATMTRQEGFAVPAPLDNKTTNSPASSFRCRSVSPAVHQKNLNGSTSNTAIPSVPRSVVSPFNSPVTPEVLNIFANSQTNLGVSNMAQRSRSVPLNIMMQTEAPPPPGQPCNSKNITSILLRKLDGDRDDAVRGLGANNLPSSYTARMNLTHILKSDPNLSCTDSHLSLMTSDSTSTCKLQRPNYLIENAINKQILLSAGDSHIQPASAEHPQAQLLTLNPHQQQEEVQQNQQLDFSNTVKDILTENSLSAGNQLMEQVSELTTGGADFPCEIRMTSELSSSINDLNALDTNLLFDPNQQQEQYQNASAEELFQQITSEATHSSGLDWLESKDHPTVGLMG
ncbi:DNA-binding protein RFX7 Regulatory factor X 7 Regulatory factor X domain-containing protein 2 [Channa argus]|uniref:DNA-binding protein RFX7 Regulatory factor X 7 Regulatory factor X domain-containing protein 2 n=1 Tax=Channa argus TaxID=215402 RepID=A0A6G1P8N1_CHAAH|nr:DNA-binding protein RFX7 Regulatory factor X 7 Regulatory factor X domain-containing protein 2 [Channa argus]